MLAGFPWASASQRVTLRDVASRSENPGPGCLWILRRPHLRSAGQESRGSSSFSPVVTSPRPPRAAYQLGLSANHARAVDATHPQLALQLRKLGINTLIHTAGPFQDQGYDVARAAIKAGCHYVDLADGRAFVNGITTLDAEARAAGVSVVSGASSLPALTSAVVDQYRGEFSRLDAIRIGITSGAVVPGVATIRADPGLLRQAISHAGERRLDRRVRLARYAASMNFPSQSEPATSAAAMSPISTCSRNDMRA